MNYKKIDKQVCDILEKKKKNGSNAVIYVRTNVKAKGPNSAISDGFVYSGGKPMNIGAAICDYIAYNRDSKEMFYGGLFMYLLNNQDQIKDFKQKLSEIEGLIYAKNN